MESLLLYVGVAAIVGGVIWILLPAGLRRQRRRRAGLWPITAGALLAGIAWLLPPPGPRHATAESLHDEFAPVFEFSEVHSIDIRASRARVDAAIRGVTAGEIFLFRALTSLRRMGRPGPENILNVPEKKSILEVATSTTFLTLADDPEREIVVGTLVMRPTDLEIPRPPSPDWFRRLDAPGIARATMNFRIDDAGRGVCRVTTETRVHATDAASRRAFARYWRIIYPGSALIRRQWLQAIRRRAEATIPP